MFLHRNNTDCTEQKVYVQLVSDMHLIPSTTCGRFFTYVSIFAATWIINPISVSLWPHTRTVLIAIAIGFSRSPRCEVHLNKERKEGRKYKKDVQTVQKDPFAKNN